MPANFWMSDPSAATQLRLAVEALGKGANLAQRLEPVLRVLDLTASQTRARLIRSAVLGLMPHPNKFSDLEIVDALRIAPWDLAQEILKLHLGNDTSVDADGTFAVGAELLTNAYGPISETTSKSLAAITFSVWSARDPDMAYAYIVRKLGNSAALDVVEGSIAELALFAPKKANRLLALLTGADLGRAAKAAVENRLPAKELAEILAQIPKGARDKLIGGYISQLSDDDDAMLEVSSVFGFDSLSAHDVEKVILGLASSAPERIRPWLTSLPAGKQTSVLGSTYEFAMGDAEKEQALSKIYLESAIASGSDNPGTTDICISRMHNTDIKSLLTLIDRFPPDRKEHLRSAAFKGQAANLPAGDPLALNGLLEVAPPEMEQTLVTIAFQRWAGSGYQVALKNIDNLESPRLKALAESAILTSNDSQIPLADRETLSLKLLADGSSQEAVVPVLTSLMTEAASESIDLGIRYLDTLPQGPARDAAASSFTRKWAELDPTSAADWAFQLPAGSLRDGAIAQLVACDRDDPEGALAAAAAIGDPTLRSKAASEVVAMWQSGDPEYLRGALKRARFSEEEIAALTTKTPPSK